MKKELSRKQKTRGKTRKSFFHHSSAAFEAAFRQRIGVSPEEWIKAKIENGSRKEDVKYLFTSKTKDRGRYGPVRRLSRHDTRLEDRTRTSREKEDSRK